MEEWLAGAHDARNFRNSRLRMRFGSREMEDSVLIGNNGYPLNRNLFKNKI